MDSFAKVLKELLEENSKKADIKKLAEYIGLANPSPVYKWLKGEMSLLLPTAIKIADFFSCSLDYLFGRSNEYGSGSYKECPLFETQLRMVFVKQKVSQYKLLKDKVVSGGNLDSWLNKKQTPHIESVIKLADYLSITLDELVGREQ